MDLDSIRTTCEGKLTIQKIFDLGFIEPKSSTCYHDRSKPNLESEHSTHVCFQEFEYEKAMKWLEEKCIG